MDIQFFKTNLYAPSVFIPKMKKEWKGYFEWKAFKQYDPACHEIVTNKTKRKDKKISVPIPGAACDPITGKAPEELQTVHVARIPLALQRIITNRRTAFLTGGKVEFKSKPNNPIEQAMYDAVTQTWRRNKLDFKNSAISKAFMSETECAEIWYSKVNEDMSVSMRCNIFSPSKGYELIPVFDSLEDLLAFGLGYESTDAKGNKIKCMDIYDKEYISKYEDTGKGWQKINESNGVPWQIEHKYGKIPVIYYSLEKAIWADVQVMIERLETLISNFADTNDYNGSPILFAKGLIDGWSTKGETGKVIQGKDDPNGEGAADLKYVNWDQAPESIKLEIETLTDFIYSLSQTPNLSFKAMAGLGDISGAAFDRMMIDSHLAAADLQNGMYGECIQRRLNFLCYAMAATQKGLEKAKDMEITVVFNKFSIDNVSDRIENAKKANGGKPVIDHLGSIKMAGLTDDAEATYQLIQEETVKETTIPALV
jgi:SPP1 family phage portal protein